MRLRKYLAERARMGGLNYDEIHGLHEGEEEREAHCTAADLKVVLDALGEIGAPAEAPGPPYTVGDAVSFLSGHKWMIGQVTDVTDNGDDTFTVTARLTDASVITKTVGRNGVGEGVAPVREH